MEKKKGENDGELSTRALPSYVHTYSPSVTLLPVRDPDPDSRLSHKAGRPLDQVFIDPRFSGEVFPGDTMTCCYQGGVT